MKLRFLTESYETLKVSGFGQDVANVSEEHALELMAPEVKEAYYGIEKIIDELFKNHKKRRGFGEIEPHLNDCRVAWTIEEPINQEIDPADDWEDQFGARYIYIELEYERGLNNPSLEIFARSPEIEKETVIGSESARFGDHYEFNLYYIRQMLVGYKAKVFGR